MKKLRELLASFDDEALAALASKGLVRRARKDLEAGAVSSVEADGDAVTVTVGEMTVTLPDTGPAFATCTCPASGCCRHILAATLHLMRDAEAGASEAAAESTDKAPEPEPGAQAELLDLSLDDLRRWAGKKALADALQLTRRAPAEIEERAAVLVRFTALGVDCRFFPGAGLDGAISSGREGQYKKLVAAAVIAYQRHHGHSVDSDEAADSGLQEASGAPRSRGQILRTTRVLLEEMVGLGLAHLSSTVRERLTTLSVSATGVHLPRLSRSLRALAEHVDLLLRRHAQADEARLFESSAEVYALCRGLESKPLPFLVGRHRSHYDEVGSLDLTGLGAWRWRTRSGYTGLTLLFLNESTGHWYSWSDSRPPGVDPGFDPARRYKDVGPWAGTSTLDQVSASRIRLTQARTNDENRLSSSEACRTSDLGPTVPEKVRFGARLFDEWAALRRHAGALYPVGLARPAELDALVVLCPTSWGRRSFDEIRQTLTWELADASGDVVTVEAVYSDVNDLLIRRLEALRPARQGVWGVCGRLVHTDRGTSLYPVSLLLAGGEITEDLVLNLTLEPLEKKTAGVVAGWARRWLRKPQASATDESVPLPAWSPSTEHQVSQLEDDLELLAECGRRSLSMDVEERLKQRAASLRGLGLELLADAVEAVPGPGPQSSEHLIRARFLCQVHRQGAIRAGIDG